MKNLRVTLAVMTDGNRTVAEATVGRGAFGRSADRELRHPAEQRAKGAS